MILSIAIAFYCLRMPYYYLILAAGHFKETQKSAFIETFLNLFLSIVFVNRYGLVGVAIGTLIALFYRTCYLARYISKNIINTKIKDFYLKLLIDTIIWIIIVAIGDKFIIEISNFGQWLLLAIKIFIISLTTTSIFNLIFYKKETTKLLSQILIKLKRATK
jgi:O-antigen/teichoic acid export membrane protein